MTTKTQSIAAFPQGKLSNTGAYTVGPEVPCGWAKSGTLYLTQTQINVADFARFYVEVSSDGEDVATPLWGFVMLVNPVIVVVAGAGFAQSTDTWLRDLPARNGTYSYTLPDLTSVRRLRVSIAEAGHVADPGELAAVVYLSDGRN